jgi:hypothetical protein
MSARAPNMRVQRTRSSASPPHSPLTRGPLGRSGKQVGLIAILFVFVAVAAGQEATPVEVPEGLEWRSIPALKAEILVPAGWHFSKTGGKDEYLVTLEDFQAKERYDTGARLILEHLAPDRDVLSEAESRIKLAARAGDVIQPFFTEEMGGLRAYGCIVRLDAGGTDMTVAFTAIGNPKTHALYTLNFQSPTAMWPGTWERGKWIVGHFKLDDEI